MKIVIFVENNSNGGMDSFLSNLINYWPHSEDELHLVANSDHPGWINLQSSITADCKFFFQNFSLFISIEKPILFTNEN